MIADHSEDSNAQHSETELPEKMIHQTIEKQGDNAQYALEAEVGDETSDVGE